MGVSVGGVLRQRSAYFRRGRMARELFGWQPVSNVMEGRGTFSAGYRALRLHAYLVHRIAYAGPLAEAPNYGKRCEAQLFTVPQTA